MFLACKHYFPVSLSAETCNQNFVVLLDEVEAAIVGHKGSDLLAVLNQLDTDALPDGRIRLLSLYTTTYRKDSIQINAHPLSDGGFQMKHTP